MLDQGINKDEARIVRELAKGGMGVVYLARAEGAVGFVKPVVVKLVLPEHASDRRFVAMFGAGAVVYPDTRDVGVQATVRGPLCHLRARYVQDTGFEVMFAFDLSIPFVFGWSK